VVDRNDGTRLGKGVDLVPSGFVRGLCKPTLPVAAGSVDYTKASVEEKELNCFSALVAAVPTSPSRGYLPRDPPCPM